MENEITRLLIHEMSAGDFREFLDFLREVANANDVAIDAFQDIHKELCSLNSNQIKAWFKKRARDGWSSVLDNLVTLLRDYAKIQDTLHGITPLS
jgi:hypothetical protein